MSRLLVHHVDLDGMGIPLVAEYLSPKFPDLAFDKHLPFDYGYEETHPELKDVIRSYDEIVVADLSFTEEFWKELIASGKKLMCYDHHETSEWLLNYPGTVVHDRTRSGTEIFFDEWYRGRRIKSIIQEFVTLVGTYDLWRDHSPLWDQAQNLNRVLHSYALWKIEDVRERFFRFFLNTHRKFDLKETWSWTREEDEMIQKALEKEQTQLLLMLERMRFRRDPKGRVFGVSHIGSKISIACYRALQETTIGDLVDYLVIVNDYKETWGKISGRSTETKFKVNTLRLLNGHPGAAGGALSEEDAHRLYDEEIALLHQDDEGTEEDMLGPAEEINLQWTWKEKS